MVELASDHPSQWAAIRSIGCSAHTLSDGVTRFDTDTGLRPRVTTDEQASRRAGEGEGVPRKRLDLDTPSARFDGLMC